MSNAMEGDLDNFSALLGKEAGWGVGWSQQSQAAFSGIISIGDAVNELLARGEVTTRRGDFIAGVTRACLQQKDSQQGQGLR